LNVPRTHHGVFTGRRQNRRRRRFLLCLVKQLVQERATPSTAGAGTKTLTELTGATWFFDPQVIHHLAFRDVKAQTEFIIQVHDNRLGKGSLGACMSANRQLQRNAACSFEVRNVK